MGVLLLKMFAGFIVGTYFGKLQASGEVSRLKGLALTISLTLILCYTIDYIIGV
jgi:hypothetical protein